MSTYYDMAQDKLNLQEKQRQIVGFSLPPKQAAAVKMEAARRGVSLKKLFDEMWALYTAKHDQTGR